MLWLSLGDLLRILWRFVEDSFGIIWEVFNPLGSFGNTSLIYTSIYIRFITCPNKFTFLKTAMNWIDFVTILPYYIEFTAG